MHLAKVLIRLGEERSGSEPWLARMRGGARHSLSLILPFPAMTIFKYQMVYICANRNRFRQFFFHDEDLKAAPQCSVHFTVF